MNITATEAKNRFGQVLEQAQQEPVFIEKAGRLHSVMLSRKRYEELLRAASGESDADRRQRFSDRYKEWIDEQNQRFAASGSWNDEFRAW